MDVHAYTQDSGVSVGLEKKGRGSLPSWKEVHNILSDSMARRSRLDRPILLAAALAISAALAVSGPTYAVGVSRSTHPQPQRHNMVAETSAEENGTPAVTVLVDGESLGSVEDAIALEAVLMAIKAPQMTGNTVTASFVEDVELVHENVSAQQLVSLDTMAERLNADRVERVDYVVEQGDTFSEIANGHGLWQAELEALNPNVDVDHINIGDTLLLTQAVPLLSVKTVDHEIYDGPVEYDVEQVPDESMYQGDSRVLVAGVDGSAHYDVNVTYVNGLEAEREVNSMDIITEPVTQVVAVGTKERPATMATGQFQWPIYGHVSSGFGYRYIFNSTSFHSGIDIAGYYGQPIGAADGGVVTFAGNDSGGYNWSFGNYVRIDHENGYETIYAHCSSLNVSVGQRVYKGQTVGFVGSTGRSTGNHCHFTVKVDGEIVNPYKYLP